MASNGFRQLSVVGGLHQLVGQLGGEHVLDPVALLGGVGAQSDEQVALSLAIALGSGLVADLLTIDELEERAVAVVQKIEDELEAELQGQVESYLEMMNSNR